MRYVRWAALAASAAAALCSGVASAEPYPLKGQIVQVLEAFDNPEAAIFSADGRFVFISNSAELGMPDKGFHFTEKAGYISKLAVQPDGTLKIVNEKLVSGVTAPLGMAVNTVATGKFPKGSIFVCMAGVPLAEANGTHIGDSSRMDPKLMVFDADGKVLGEIKMGLGSAFEKISGAPATLPNAAGFDKDGNLYVADTGIGGAAFTPPVKVAGGVWMIQHDSIDALASGRDASLFFVPMPHSGPDGLEVAPDGSIHTNTVGAVAGMPDPGQGAMYRLTKADFQAGRLPLPFAHGLGALDGLDFAGMVRLDTEIARTSSVVVTPPFGQPMTLALDKERKFAGPADIAVRKQNDGTWLLVVPELSAVSPNNKNDPVTVIRLPAGF